MGEKQPGLWQAIKGMHRGDPKSMMEAAKALQRATDRLMVPFIAVGALFAMKETGKQELADISGQQRQGLASRAREWLTKLSKTPKPPAPPKV